MNLRILLLSAFGYQVHIIKKMPTKSGLTWLSISYILSFLSALIIAFSFSNIFYLKPDPGWQEFTLRTLFFFLIVSLVYLVHCIFVYLQAFPISSKPNNTYIHDKKWNKNFIPVLVMGLMAFMSSQFLLMYFNNSFFKSNTQSIVDKYVAQIRQFESDKVKKQINELIVEKKILENYLVNNIDDKTSQIGKILTPEVVTIYDKKFNENKRKALVIGVNNYKYVRPLENATQDAAAIANSLKRLGFSVIQVMDMNSEEIKEAFYQYRKILQPGDTSLIYYAGHGYQFDQKNYITGNDIDGKKIQSGNQSGIDILQEIQFISNNNQTPLNANILLLDACRTIPQLNLKKGLAPIGSIPISGNYIIGLAAQPNTEADDSSYTSQVGKHGLFTGVLLRYIDKSFDLVEILNKVTKDVRNISKDLQQPEFRSSLTNQIFLKDQSISSSGFGQIQNFIVNRQSICFAEARNNSFDLVSSCIRSEINFLKDKIQVNDNYEKNLLEKKLNAFEQDLKESAFIQRRLAYIWEKPMDKLIALFWTILITFGLISGELLRWVSLPSWLASKMRPNCIDFISRYEQLNLELSKNLLTQFQIKKGDDIRLILNKNNILEDAVFRFNLGNIQSVLNQNITLKNNTEGSSASINMYYLLKKSLG
jgi:hypothetical protein